MVAMRDSSGMAVGRFAGWEPLGFEAGDENWYRFVANGPTAKTDPSGLYEPANTRPGTRPKGVPDGTRPIEMIPEMTCELIHKVKERLKRGGEGVGPKTWVGIDPDGNVWVPDFNGNGENLGGWQLTGPPSTAPLSEGVALPSDSCSDTHLCLGLG